MQVFSLTSITSQLMHAAGGMLNTHTSKHLDSFLALPPWLFHFECSLSPKEVPALNHPCKLDYNKKSLPPKQDRNVTVHRASNVSFYYRGKQLTSLRAVTGVPTEIK